ncbi:nuclear transport factor 2 family protein [Rhodospirillum sp. A1_3_36]|uniref:nuclear transport factor 2 family protein n=1 Tax=Rhodospirillum sp. A1_3_36 TaxID=3391666 RepID=UPI0039A54828
MTNSTEITNTIEKYFSAIDTRDWSTAEALMTTPFHLDYSSMGAGPAADLLPSDILAGWKSILPGFDHTHHQLGNLDLSVSDSQATVTCHVTATHFIDNVDNDPIWVVVGTYTIGLVRDETGWKICALTLTFKYQSGNTSLPTIAQDRARPRPEATKPSEM